MQTQDRQRLLGDGEPAGGAFVAAASLGFTGFFFPLLQPMFRMSGYPAIRQQGF